MKTQIGQRLARLRTELHLTAAELAERCGLKDYHIEAVEHGRSKLSQQRMELICSNYHVRKEWLESGEGYFEIQLSYL